MRPIFQWALHSLSEHFHREASDRRRRPIVASLVWRCRNVVPRSWWDY
jgi:hypothetical protein